MVFKWKDGSRRSGNAQKVGEELMKIKEKEGNIQAEAVVKRAASKRSPLHSQFNWDNDSAAHQHRLEQARSLIRSIVSITPENRGEDVPVFTAVSGEKPNTSVYIPLDEGLAHQPTREEILGRAKAELRAFRRKYAKLKELSAVFDVIDDLIDERPQKKQAAG
jgi:vacuolar-type H+-ATPase subunit H